MDKNFWEKLPKPIFALAPMVGVSDLAFRTLCKRYGADLVYTEMTSADAILHDADKALRMIEVNGEEQPAIVQIMGKGPEILAKAAKVAEKMGAAGIDINFGCPAHKIVKTDSGAFLVRNLPLCKSLIAAVCEAVSIPVSIKTRVSINKNPKAMKKTGKDVVTVLDFIEYVKDLPISAIMVHGRSFEDSFDGDPRFDVVAEVKKRFKGVVLSNGGVDVVEKIPLILQATKADGIGFGRSAIGHPWIFQQAKDLTTSGLYKELPWKEVSKIILEHAELFEKNRGRRPFVELRRHLTHYVKGIQGASELRQKLTQVENISDIKKILKLRKEKAPV